MNLQPTQEGTISSYKNLGVKGAKHEVSCVREHARLADLRQGF